MQGRAAIDARLGWALFGGQEALQSLLKRSWHCGLALPDRENSPTEATKRGRVALIASGIPFEFFAPPSSPRFRNSSMLALPVVMPKAAVNKKANPVAGKHDVGIAREVATVKTETIAHGMEHSANNQFRLGMLPSNARHEAAAFDYGECVYHRKIYILGNPRSQKFQPDARSG